MQETFSKIENKIFNSRKSFKGANGQGFKIAHPSHHILKKSIHEFFSINKPSLILGQIFWARKGRKVEVIKEREGEGIGGSYATMRLEISPSREEAKEKEAEAIIAMATLR